MADIDIDPIGEHESRPDEPTGESIPLTPVGGGAVVVTQAQVHAASEEQETLFGEKLTLEQGFTNTFVDSLYKELSKYYPRIHDAIHYDRFRCDDNGLYYKGRDKPLTNMDGKLKTIGQLETILGQRRLFKLGFDASEWPISKKVEVLKKAQEELPSRSDIAKADNIELQEMTKKHQ